MQLSECLRALNEVVPLASAGYARDAVGLQVGLAGDPIVKRILVAYEVTSRVIDEAREFGANLIVAFHPLIFPTLSSVVDSSRTGALVRSLIKADIALYVVHTAFDAHPLFGTSRLMAEVLELESIAPLAPLESTLRKIVVYTPHSAVADVHGAMAAAGAGNIGNYSACAWQVEGRGTFRGNERSTPAVGERLMLESVDEVRLEMICETWNLGRVLGAMRAAHPYEEVAHDIYALETASTTFGMGTIGRWNTALDSETALEKIKVAFGATMLRHNRTSKRTIATVAMLGGAGMDYYSAAKSARADLFLTADIRYHDFFRAEHDDILLVDTGHAETERFVPRGIERALKFALANHADHPTARVLSAASGELPILVSQAEANAVQYF